MGTRKNFPLRISHELYVDLKRIAEEELRSVNGQIEYLLKQAVSRRKPDRTVSDSQVSNAIKDPPADD